MMKNYSYKDILNKRGAIMVLFAILLPVLFGFVGFGFDVGLLYMQKGKLQDIADATALAGAAHLGEEGDAVAKAVADFAKANGLDVNENSLVAVNSGGWNSLAQLGDNEELRVAYGVVTVDNKERLRVRIDKRVQMPFVAVLTSAWDKGLPVAAVAAAEGNVGDEPVFRIIGRNGVYDHFFNLSGASSAGDPDKWIKGSIYAGNMLRASYKQNNPQQARNMVSVDGYIFADMMNTGLPLMNGVTGTSSSPSDDRIFRSDYVRKKDGDKWLSGFDALTKSDYRGSGWSGNAQQLAEQKLSEYSSTLTAMIKNGDYKRKAMNKEGKCRYICNKAVKEELDSKGISVPDLKFERVNDKGVEQSGWRDKEPKDMNHQYSNINIGEEEIDVLYVEIQGDNVGQRLESGREGAVWLGAYPKTDKLRRVNLLIVELKTEGLTADKLTGSFIIMPGSSGCEFGAIYSQANLEIRAPFGQQDGGNYNSFTGPVFSEKFVSFSYDDKCGGNGRAHPHFGKDAVIAGNVVLFGYGYEIGPNVVVDEKHMGTHYYDDFTNFKTATSTVSRPDNWWNAGIKTVDHLDNSDQVFVMSGFDFHDEQYVKDNPGAQNEIELLQKLWAAIDGRDQDYNEDHNVTINLKGSLYGDYGRWPTEFSNGGSSSIRMCTFDGYDGNGSTTTTLKLVE